VVTTVDIQAWLRVLMESIATAAPVDARVRHALLVDVLAPLGLVDADRRAAQIEQHAYWVRYGTHASGDDRALSRSVDEAVFLVGRALDAAVEEMG
jgi:hypothetical protein